MQLMKAEELAEALQVSVSLIRHMTSEGRLPFKRLPGSTLVRYVLEDVLGALEEVPVRSVKGRALRLLR